MTTNNAHPKKQSKHDNKTRQNSARQTKEKKYHAHDGDTRAAPNTNAAPSSNTRKRRSGRSSRSSTSPTSTTSQSHPDHAKQSCGFDEYALQTGLIDRYRSQLRAGMLEVADQTDRLMRAHLFFSYMLHDWVDLSARVGAKAGKIVHGVISELGQAMMGIKGALQVGSYVSAVPLVRMVMERAMVLDILFEHDDKAVYTDRITQYEEYSLVQERNYYVFSQKDVPSDLQASYDKVIKRYQRDKKTGKTTRYNGIHKKTGVRMLLQRYGYDTLFGGDLYSMTSTVMHGSALVANFMHPKNGLLPLYDETKITGMIDLTLKLADRGVTSLRCLVPPTKRDAFVHEWRSMTGVTATDRISIPTTTSSDTAPTDNAKKTTKKKRRKRSKKHTSDTASNSEHHKKHNTQQPTDTQPKKQKNKTRAKTKQHDKREETNRSRRRRTKRKPTKKTT